MNCGNWKSKPGRFRTGLAWLVLYSSTEGDFCVVLTPEESLARNRKLKVIPMAAKSKYRFPKPKMEANGDEFAFHDDNLEMTCPKLFDLLSRQLDQGKVVKPASLSVFAQAGNLTACLNWDAEDVILFVGISSSEMLFSELEAKLGSKDLAWRKKKPKYQSR